ncbi:hypothetical protein O209_03525 [Lactiplantibacillus plantarum WHE 92]|nr:hypothetical protein O209_03525 [Lactiplantibacillus plantarum WHE 92]
MPKPTTDDVNRQQLYSDAYFDTGHWGLKIRQTIVGIVGWLAVIVPITVTVLSIWSSYNPHIPRFWHYHEGLFEFKFIGILLAFCFALASLFAVTMTIIQNRKRERVVEQWPTFNPINQKKNGSNCSLSSWRTVSAMPNFVNIPALPGQARTKSRY